jgi:AraC-like DNA-binding protein
MKLKNIHTYNYVVILALNCDLYINKKGERVIIECGTIAIIEKNISFDVELIRKGSGDLYKTFEIEKEMLCHLRGLLEPLIQVSPESYIRKRRFFDRVFKLKSCPIAIEIFNELMVGDNSLHSNAYKLVYLFSKSHNVNELAMSIYSSVAISFSEKISNLFLKDISRKWRLSDVAYELHMSEISIRKKLEQEAINFNQLLLDARMNLAAKYIIRTDHQISMVASLVGYSSISYFIKTFKDYYGLTPKQFEIGIKENIICD